MIAAPQGVRGPSPTLAATTALLPQSPFFPPPGFASATAPAPTLPQIGLLAVYRYRSAAAGCSQRPAVRGGSANTAAGWRRGTVASCPPAAAPTHHPRPRDGSADAAGGQLCGTVTSRPCDRSQRQADSQITPAV